MIPPISARATSWRRCPRCSGVSRTTTIRRPPFLQGDVARARDQRVGVAGGEGGDGLHAAGGHDHALGAERAAGHRGADVAVVVHDVGEGLDVLDREVRLLGEGALGGGAQDEVQLEGGALAQLLEQAHAVDRARRPGDRDTRRRGGASVVLERARFATKADSTTLESPGPPIRRTDPRRTPRIPSARSPVRPRRRPRRALRRRRSRRARRRPRPGGGNAGPQYHELLPDIGLIGAQVGIAGGASWNPFEVGRGIQAAGFVDLPLARLGRGKLSYEILVGLSDARSEPFVITDQIAYVANLATGASRAAALAGPPARAVPRAARGAHAAAPAAGVALRAQVHAAPAGQRAAAAVRRSRPRLRRHHHPPGPGGRREPRVHGHRSVRCARSSAAPWPRRRSWPRSATRRARGTSTSGSTPAAAWRSGSRGACRVNFDYRFTSIGSGHGCTP